MCIRPTIVFQGTPQFVQLTFPAPVIPRRIILTFQGGFVGTRCSIQASSPDAAKGKAEWRTITHIYPEDVNRKQTFDIPPEETVTMEAGIADIRIVFEESSDFFGRITVYDLQVEGQAV